VIALALLIAAFTAAGAQAATVTVTNTEDGAAKCPSATECTLRGAIEFAKAGDTIALGAATYTLAGNPIRIEEALTITGAGAGATILTTSSPSRLLEVDDSEVTISGVTLKKGAFTEGGAVYNYESILRLSNCAFLENVAQHAAPYNSGKNEEGGKGGAIYNYYGKVNVSSCTFEGNTAEGASTGTESNYNSYGGAIYNYGSLTISASTFNGNLAEGDSNKSATKYNEGGTAGAIYSYGKISVSGSTFTANTAGGGANAEGGAKGGYAGEAGALYTEGEGTIANSTFSGNKAESGANGSGTNYGSAGEGGALYNYDGSLTVNSSMVKENTAASTHYGGYGGGVYSYGSLTLNGSTVTGNQAPNGDGGGVYNDGGRVTLIQSTVSGNQVSNTVTSGSGGGIYNSGNLGLFQSTVSGNQAPEGYGGGIYNAGTELELTQSTVGPSNLAADGGGVYNDAPLAATNTTIADNTASEYGGGLYNEEVGSLANVTLFGNAAERASSGGNVYLDDYDLTLHDTLIAAGVAPTSGGNCAFEGTSGLVVSKGYNAEDANQCTLEPKVGDQVGAVLDLAPLGSYGGPTQTVALLAGSAAIDKGDPAGCTGAEGELLTVDQRGVARPQNGRCDTGAFEYVFPVPVPSPAPVPSAPRVSGLSIKPRSFAPTSNSASIARHRKGKVPKGAKVIYTDSEAATTTFTVVRLQHGHRVHGLCKVTSKHGKKSKHGKACTKETAIKGSFTHVDAAGRNQFEFTGHVGGRKLAKGTYVLIARPKLGTLSGPRVSAVFEIA
jgi:hypothetical protein